MDTQQAQNIIKETFESPFNKGRFTAFVRNFLSHIDEDSFTYKGNYVPDPYKPYIKTLERIGKFSDGENSVDILVITLKKDSSLERARTMQRNFVSWYLNGSRGGKLKDAALVAYVSPDQADWRFSLVKMDYTFEKGKGGNIKVKEEFTPARRWSFLVGENEKSHTAQSRLVKILANDEQAPTLAELENAFDIETVTKEFFLQYRELFLRTKEALDKAEKENPKVKKDFKAKGVDTVNFAKKLLGQVVFLYFLQKKGWFGVGRDNSWGTGSKHFLRDLFAKEHGDYKNFFNGILEPLFYEALRRERDDVDHYYSQFNCKIPFLNGGLFDPIGNYDWVHADIHLPDELFSNTRKTKEGDTGDGILDVFDRYNFTVREDEPLEKEVAIDPELLGKAYEKFNAIRPENFDEFTKTLKSGKTGEENKFNKKFGVYYTPREIVHYMCKQSLINYLFTQAEEADLASAIQKQDIEILIEIGERVTENEAIALAKQKNIKGGAQKSTGYSAHLPDSIRENAAAIDNWLADITVCDPAVGSGAFPVGMMSEIVRARNVLSLFLGDKGRNDYEFKHRCIEHSLYGVDIDPGAVEIAKLRLWLSLIVDEEDIKNIKPLPNLDYKVVCGNSLLGVEIDLLNRNLFDELEALKPLHFNETNPTKKQEYNEQIDNLINQITNGHTEFDFEVYFSEVFHTKGGFDVVIANPPYSAKQSTETKSLTKFYDYVEFKCDPYAFFIELGWRLTKKHGQQTYIVPVTWMTNYYYMKIRSLLIKTLSLKQIVLFNGLVFESANVDTCLLFVHKEGVLDKTFTWIATQPSLENTTPQNREYGLVEKEERLDIVPRFDSRWEKVREKVEKQSVRLDEISKISLGMKLKGNDAFVVKNKDKAHSDPIYFGSDISLYGTLKPTRFFNRQSAEIIGGTKNPAVHSAKPKILVQAIRNLSLNRRIVATIDFQGNSFIGTVNSIILKNKDYDVTLLLAILNSSLLNAYFRNRFTTISLTSAFLGVLPIKRMSDIQKDAKLLEISTQITRFVEQIFDITKDDDYQKNQQKQLKVKTIDREIDKLVYQLYGLTKKEINIVEGGTQ